MSVRLYHIVIPHGSHNLPWSFGYIVGYISAIFSWVYIPFIFHSIYFGYTDVFILLLYFFLVDILLSRWIYSVFVILLSYTFSLYFRHISLAVHRWVYHIQVVFDGSMFLSYTRWAGYISVILLHLNYFYRHNVAMLEVTIYPLVGWWPSGWWASGQRSWSPRSVMVMGHHRMVQGQWSSSVMPLAGMLLLANVRCTATIIHRHCKQSFNDAWGLIMVHR